MTVVIDVQLVSHAGKPAIRDPVQACSHRGLAWTYQRSTGGVFRFQVPSTDQRHRSLSGVRREHLRCRDNGQVCTCRTAPEGYRRRCSMEASRGASASAFAYRGPTRRRASRCTSAPQRSTAAMADHRRPSARAPALRVPLTSWLRFAGARCSSQFTTRLLACCYFNVGVIASCRLSSRTCNRAVLQSPATEKCASTKSSS
jgi:hypothetical protein